MQITIRKMVVEDAAAGNYNSSQPGYSFLKVETSRQIETLLTLNEHLAFVATNEDRVIGWIHAFKFYSIESLLLKKADWWQKKTAVKRASAEPW